MRPSIRKRNKKVWTATLANLEKLKAAQPVPEQPLKIVVLLEQARDAEDNLPDGLPANTCHGIADTLQT